jgi:putative addiction module component (TIGR02574 family)
MSTASPDFRQLPISERIQLVADIWDSIAQETSVKFELTTDQSQELQRRLADHVADPASSTSWDDVRAELFKGDL